MIVVKASHLVSKLTVAETFLRKSWGSKFTKEVSKQEQTLGNPSKMIYFQNWVPMELIILKIIFFSKYWINGRTFAIIFQTSIICKVQRYAQFLTVLRIKVIQYVKIPWNIYDNFTLPNQISPQLLCTKQQLMHLLLIDLFLKQRSEKMGKHQSG